MKKISKEQIDELNALPITGGSMEGELNVLPPINSSNPTTKKYVDEQIGDISTILATIVEGV